MGILVFGGLLAFFAFLVAFGLLVLMFAQGGSNASQSESGKFNLNLSGTGAAGTKTASEMLGTLLYKSSTQK